MPPEPHRRRLHVLCAPPNGFNPGMTSVDLALSQVAREAGATEVAYWRLWDQAEWFEPPGGSRRVDGDAFIDDNSGLTYRLVRERIGDFLDADAVVYWGDFLHMAVYQRHNADVLTRRTGLYANVGEANDVVARHLLLRDRPAKDLEHVFSFGTTLSFNTAHDYAGRYGADLAHLVGGVGGIWHRDPYSAMVSQSLRPQGAPSCKGVDAAFLLTHRGGLDGSKLRDERLGVFIGRSDFRPEAVASFGRDVARALDLRPEWVPWGAEPGFWPMHARRRFRAAWPALERRATRLGAAQTVSTLCRALADVPLPAPLPDERAMDTLFDQIVRCSVVVTDTYHLAVNAWRLGTPAVCLVDDPQRGWSVNAGESGSTRDKRTDLYSQLEALPLLVDGSRLALRHAEEVARIVAALRDTTAVGVTHRRVAERTARARSTVVDALRARLGAVTPSPGR